MDGKNICFKIDTGAEVSAISTDAFEALGRSNWQELTKKLCPKLKPTEGAGLYYI